MTLNGPQSPGTPRIREDGPDRVPPALRIPVRLPITVRLLRAGRDGPDPPRVRIGGRGIGIRGPARNAGPAARTVRRRIRAPSLMTEWGHGPHRGGW